MVKKSSQSDQVETESVQNATLDYIIISQLFSWYFTRLTGRMSSSDLVNPSFSLYLVT